ncbi:TPA: hypothetical protein ACH3X1_013390 [Trebouxia sp. C0004]
MTSACSLQRQSSILSADTDPAVRAVQAETALEALKIKFQGATKEYEEIIQELSAENEELKGELEQAATGATADGSESMHQQNAELQQQLQSSQEQLRILQEMLKASEQGTASSVEQQQMVTQLQQQNQLMSQQLAQLQVQLSTSEQAVANLQGQHQAALSGLSALQAQHSMLSSQHAELQTQHETLDKAHAKRDADHESANGSLAALMTQSTVLQRQHAETVSSLNMLKGDHEALSRQHAGLQEKYQVQEQQATSAQSSLASLQSAYSAVKAQHDSTLVAQAGAEQRLAASSSELNALQTRHATQQAELSSVSAERDRLTQAGTSHATELSQTQRDLSSSQVQLENSREQHKQVQEKLAAHEAGLTQLQQQHYQTVAERDTALKQNESTARELKQLRESSAVLQQQLHVMTLEKQSEAEKSAKAATELAGSRQNIAEQSAEYTRLIALHKAETDRGDRAAQEVEQLKMSAGDLKQQLAVAHAERAEFNEKAIQASTQAEGLQTQVQELTVSMQQCTAELDMAVNNGRTANEQLQKLRGEASVLQLWQQNVQAERAAEIETVRSAKQEAELLRPQVPALETEVARLQVEVQDRNKGLRHAQNEEALARAQAGKDAAHAERLQEELQRALAEAAALQNKHEAAMADGREAAVKEASLVQQRHEQALLELQERHDVLGRERQSEFNRASAAEVASAAMQVQLTAHQERGAHLTTQLQESNVQIQVLQDKVAAASQRITELETQLSNERERAVSAEEHGRSVERQLAEEQQNRDRTAKKREEAEAELAAQVLKYSEILSQLENARQDAAQVSRALDASRAETQAAKVSSDAVAADKARTEDKLSQHLEEHVKLDQAHSALGARLQEEQANSAQLNGQLQDGQAAAAKLQRTIADLEQQVQEAEERSKAAAAKHESCLQQLSAEHAHTLELDSQIEDQYKMLREHARSLDDARQQHNAVAAEVAAVQQEMTQLQITHWQPILAAFDQQLEAAAANSATACMEAATAKKMLAAFQVAITTQVASLEERLGVDAAELAKVQAELTEQQGHSKEAEEAVEVLKKENGTMKGHAVKLKNAQKEIERLREAWRDKDVQLAEANSQASNQRHAASEAQARLHGHEGRMADLQKEVDSAQRLMRSAQLQAREAVDEKSTLTDKILTLEGELKALHKVHEGSKLNLTQAIEACNFATKKRRAAERQLAKLQEAPQKPGGAKAESSALGNNLREYEALAKEVKVLRQAVDTSAAEARESQAEVVILKRKLEDRSRGGGSPRLGSPAPGNSPRVASTNQGSPLRGVPSHGALNSPSGSPSTSAVFSPGSLLTGDDSPAAYSASSSPPAQSLPERAYSSQAREAAAAAELSRGEAEGKAPELKETVRRLQGQLSKQSEGARASTPGSASGQTEGGPYMQGYQTTIGQGLRQEGYRKSGSFQRAPEQSEAAANMSSGLARADSNSPSGFARVSSDKPNLYQDTDKIGAMRPSGYEEAEEQGLSNSAAAAATAAPPLARRQSSLMQKGRLTTRPSVADRLKNVRGMLAFAEANGNGSDEISEELPVATVAAVQEYDDAGLDEAIAEEPQLATN